MVYFDACFQKLCPNRAPELEPMVQPSHVTTEVSHHGDRKLAATAHRDIKQNCNPSEPIHNDAPSLNQMQGCNVILKKNYLTHDFFLFTLTEQILISIEEHFIMLMNLNL